MQRIDEKSGDVDLLAGQAAKILGIGVQTLHYYEREGLLPVAKRTPAGYRLYSPEQVERVTFIRKAQSLGLPLEEIKMILAITEHGRCPCAEVKAALDRELDEVDRRLQELRRFRRELVRLVDKTAEWNGKPDERHYCSIVEEGSKNSELRSPEFLSPRRVGIRKSRRAS